jgi:hypothetical protein
MIVQHVQGAWSGAVCNQAQLTNWQNVIPYGGTKRENDIFIRSHGSLTGKCYHQNFPHWKSNKHCKCRWLMHWRIPNYSELLTDGWQISAISTCRAVFCPSSGVSSVSQRLGNHLPIYRNSLTQAIFNVPPGPAQIENSSSRNRVFMRLNLYVIRRTSSWNSTSKAPDRADPNGRAV